jgi:YtkA-like
MKTKPKHSYVKMGMFTAYCLLPCAYYLVTTLCFLLIAGIVHARGYEAVKKAGEYEVEINIDRNPPIVGDNHLTLEIKGGGKHVTDAQVLVNYYMPPMPRMAPMNYKTNASLKGHKYVATMKLIMSGPWNIAVIFTHGGKAYRTKFTIDAQ